MSKEKAARISNTPRHEAGERGGHAPKYEEQSKDETCSAGQKNRPAGEHENEETGAYRGPSPSLMEQVGFNFPVYRGRWQASPLLFVHDSRRFRYAGSDDLRFLGMQPFQLDFHWQPVLQLLLPFPPFKEPGSHPFRILCSSNDPLIEFDGNIQVAGLPVGSFDSAPVKVNSCNFGNMQRPCGDDFPDFLQLHRTGRQVIAGHTKEPAPRRRLFGSVKSFSEASVLQRNIVNDIGSLIDRIMGGIAGHRNDRNYGTADTHRYGDDFGKGQPLSWLAISRTSRIFTAFIVFLLG